MPTIRDRNPYLFVVGCPRSGTTLLQRMLDHHSQLAVANDTHFIPRSIEKHDRQAIGKAIREGDLALSDSLIECVRRYRRFARLGLPDATVDKASKTSKTYREFVSSLYSAYARQRGKPLAAEKTPDYVRRLPLLHALFTWSKTVHIVRDGRDVALSLLDWASETKGPGKLKLWREEPIAVCALWWRWLVGTGRRDGRVIGATRYCEVSYEELVRSPREHLQRITSFLDLPFDVKMLSYHRGKMRSSPGLSAKKAWLPPTPGLRDWRTQMSARDLELFEALAGDLLDELGYERSVVTVSPRTSVLARSCQEWWDATMPPGRAKNVRSTDSITR